MKKFMLIALTAAGLNAAAAAETIKLPLETNKWNKTRLGLNPVSLSNPEMNGQKILCVTLNKKPENRANYVYATYRFKQTPGTIHQVLKIRMRCSWQPKNASVKIFYKGWDKASGKARRELERTYSLLQKANTRFLPANKWIDINIALKAKTQIDLIQIAINAADRPNGEKLSLEFASIELAGK